MKYKLICRSAQHNGRI